MFDKIPKCEACGQNEAISFSYFAEGMNDGTWRYTCACTTDSETYFVMIKDFFATPAATVDWLAHLGEKTWMDWHDFNAMMCRLRDAVR